MIAILGLMIKYFDFDAIVLINDLFLFDIIFIDIRHRIDGGSHNFFEFKTLRVRDPFDRELFGNLDLRNRQSDK